MELIDNINRLLGDDLKRALKPGARLKVAASCFSMYAFEALKEELEQVDELHFIFTSPNRPVTRLDEPLLLFDFSVPADVDDWGPIDDRVMGGLSRSRLRHDPAGHAVFEGEVSLERSGGFASVRSKPGARGKPGAEACLLDVRGAGKQYKLSLLTDAGFDSLSYQANFTAEGTGWQTLRLPLATFRASFRGREVGGAPPLDPARICQVGLMIAARQAGPFSLDIKRIRLA